MGRRRVHAPSPFPALHLCGGTVGHPLAPSATFRAVVLGEAEGYPRTPAARADTSRALLWTDCSPRTCSRACTGWFRRRGQLFEVPLGSTDHLPSGPVVHGPWLPADCSSVLTRWLELGWLTPSRRDPSGGEADLVIEEANASDQSRLRDWPGRVGNAGPGSA